MNNKLNQEVIELLNKGDTVGAWNLVKHIGKNINSNIDLRFVIFLDCVATYDYKKNNHFIAYYLTNLNYKKFDDTDFLIFSQNFRVAKKLLNEKISPSGKSSKYVDDLKNWNV